MLTHKRARFVEEYLVDQNATQAALRAGYAQASAHNTGVILLKNREVQDLLRVRQREIVAFVDVTVQDIVREAWSIATDKTAPHSARVQALVLLSKRHPDFSEKLEVTERVELKAMQLVAELSTDDIRALLRD